MVHTTYKTYEPHDMNLVILGMVERWVYNMTPCVVFEIQQDTRTPEDTDPKFMCVCV